MQDLPPAHIEIIVDKEKYWTRVRELQQEHYVLYDLHVHSSCSDGYHSIHEIAVRCKEKEINAALTDHNVIADSSGLPESEKSVILPAIEVTSREGVDVLYYFHSWNELEEFYRSFVAPFRLTPYKVSHPLKGLLRESANHRCLVTIPHPEYPADPLRTNFYKMFRQGLLGRKELAAITCLEVFNSSRNHSLPGNTMNLLKELAVRPVAGSDAHMVSAVGHALTAAKAETHEEFLASLAAGRFFTIATSTGVISRTAPKFKMAWLHIKGLIRCP